jgi:imidazolonepropionase-like amidohydrolase
MRTVLDGARVFDGTAAREGLAVAIEGDRIAEVGPAATVRRPGDEMIALDGLTIVPGIVNGADYLSMKQTSQYYYDIYRQSGHYQLLRCVRSALVLLSQGVTTTVDVGAFERVTLMLRNAIEMGLVVGPRIVTSGTPIKPWLGGEGVDIASMTVDANDADEVRRHAEQLVEAGVDYVCVKMERENFKTKEVRSFSVEELRAAVDVARAAGKRVHVLAREPHDIGRAIEGGADSISCGLNLWRVPEAAKEMAARGIFYTSSASSWPRGPRPVPDRDKKHRDSLRTALDAGVKVVPSIDLYGTNPVDELVVLTEMGLSPGQALVAATRTGAEMVGLADDIGTIAPGKRADFVVVEGDPTRDIEAMRAVRWTIRSGERYAADEVERLVGRSTTITAPQKEQAPVPVGR